MPLNEIVISHTTVFLSLFGTSEHKSLEIFSGNIGITLDGKYMEVPLCIASLSKALFVLTSPATSAIATLKIYED